jgi:hypothetical protein
MAHSYRLILGTAIAALSFTSPATAQPPATETFAGTCEMSGVIRNQPPLTVETAYTRFHGSFRGVCTGQLTERDGSTRQLDASPARYEGRGEGELSCNGGTSYGTGALIFAGGQRIDFSLTERRAPGAAFVTLEGAAGGTATVLGTVSRDEDLAELNERCNGDGIRFLRGDARIVSPGISG